MVKNDMIEGEEEEKLRPYRKPSMFKGDATECFRCSKEPKGYVWFQLIGDTSPTFFYPLCNEAYNQAIRLFNQIPACSGQKACVKCGKEVEGFEAIRFTKEGRFAHAVCP